MMNYLKWTLIGLVFTVSWNVFLIDRDRKMFDAYDQIQTTQTK